MVKQLICIRNNTLAFIMLISFTMVCALDCRAQDIDHQFWMNYALTIPVNNQLSYGGDVGFRGLGSNQNWTQVLLRPTVSYKFKNQIGIAGALAWFGTFNKDDFNYNEFRIHQDFTFKWPDFVILELFYRLRIEERFFFYQENRSNTFKMRVRYLIGAESQDIRLFGSKRPIYFQAIYEGFKTLADENAYEIFINQVRIHGAFGHRISNSFRYELHYIVQKSRLFSDDGLNATQNNYRIRIFHRLQKE